MSMCKRMLVEAIGIDNNFQPLYTTNYNENECSNEVGNCGCIHAEHSLLSKMENVEIIVVSHSPCLNCAKLIVEHGVKVVVYKHEYRIKDGIEYLKEHGVKVVRVVRA